MVRNIEEYREQSKATSGSNKIKAGSRNKVTPAPDAAVSNAHSRHKSFHPVLEREEATLVLFSELMKKKQLTAMPLGCDTELAMATHPDVVKVAKGFVFLVMSSPSEEEAVMRCLDKYLILKTLNDALLAYFEELLVLRG